MVTGDLRSRVKKFVEKTGYILVRKGLMARTGIIVPEFEEVLEGGKIKREKIEERIKGGVVVEYGEEFEKALESFFPGYRPPLTLAVEKERLGVDGIYHSNPYFDLVLIGIYRKDYERIRDKKKVKLEELESVMGDKIYRVLLHENFHAYIERIGAGLNRRTEEGAATAVSEVLYRVYRGMKLEEAMEDTLKYLESVKKGFEAGKMSRILRIYSRIRKKLRIPLLLAGALFSSLALPGMIQYSGYLLAALLGESGIYGKLKELTGEETRENYIDPAIDFIKGRLKYLKNEEKLATLTHTP